MQKGFTLMELLIVIAIIGILAVIGVPFVQNYFAKSQATEAFTLTSNLRNEVSLYAMEHGGLDNITNDTGISEHAKGLKGKYIDASGVSVGDKGVISISFSSGANKGQKLELTPELGSNAIHWKCDSSSMKTEHLPSACEKSSTPATTTPSNN